MKSESSEDRDALDRYYTPPPFSRAHIRRLIDEAFLTDNMTVIDAGCGDGSYLDALMAECRRANLVGVKVFGVDLDRDAAHKLAIRGFGPSTGKPGDIWMNVICQSFLELEMDADLVVGNPPFGIAELFIAHAKKLATSTSFLLQSQFVSGKKRFESKIWHHFNRLDPFTKRPKFYGPAIDLINERRKREGKKPAGGNAVDYSAFTWSSREGSPDYGMKPEALEDAYFPDLDFRGRHIVPIEDNDSKGPQDDE
jgi:predicted RNA methylase